MGNPKPVRSEVWLIDFGIAAKVRPALVVSEPHGDEDRALIAVVPHTTSIRRSKYEIQVSPPFLKKNGVFLLQGFVTVPPAYFVKKLGMLSGSQMELIENGLRDWLSL
ncbi:MAG: type II toxin-antitoxin system PemK/MazF family toxin [Chloroflexaceae bacterium]|nr:type II toxin-antitoxin system PemK/MazF family toxin [Chloroflexaceae bacterium]